ncbi:hypothetical protein BKA65DRAFT_415313, partial [Rhexocercosporidium sp. MPI-PUGE-AT-0058]
NLQSLVSYLPQCSHRSILITTRSEDKALSLVEQRDLIKIELIRSADTLELFKIKLRRVNDRSNNADVTAKLLTALEFMPLAVIQVIIYIL